MSRQETSKNAFFGCRVKKREKTPTRVGARHCSFTPSLWSAAVPPYPLTMVIGEHRQLVKTPLVNRCQTCYSFWWENYLTHRSGERWTTINSPSDRTPLGCRSLMDCNFICLTCEHPVVRNKILFPSKKSQGWSNNLWGCPWASMIISQPFVNHWRASSVTVKYKIFNWIAHLQWASTFVHSFCGETALYMSSLLIVFSQLTFRIFYRNLWWIIVLTSHLLMVHNSLFYINTLAS